MQPYDSYNDTMAHIERVQELLHEVRKDLSHRLVQHDQSKLQEPEKSVFDRETPNLKGMTYGSAEYKASLARLGEALQHHYANNSHHPEHYPDGIRGMNLLDVIEMLVDWKAATERHADGNIRRSIDQNQERFGYSDDIKSIFHNTVSYLKWDSAEVGED